MASESGRRFLLSAAIDGEEQTAVEIKFDRETLQDWHNLGIRLEKHGVSENGAFVLFYEQPVEAVSWL